jgi:hypothetical protein
MTPGLSLSDSLEVKGNLTFLNEEGRVHIPGRSHYAFVTDNQDVIGVVCSRRNGFPSKYTARPMVFKKYAPGHRPVVLYN